MLCPLCLSSVCSVYSALLCFWLPASSVGVVLGASLAWLSVTHPNSIVLTAVTRHPIHPIQRNDIRPTDCPPLPLASNPPGKPYPLLNSCELLTHSLIPLSTTCPASLSLQQPNSLLFLTSRLSLSNHSPVITPPPPPVIPMNPRIVHPVPPNLFPASPSRSSSTLLTHLITRPFLSPVTNYQTLICFRYPATSSPDEPYTRRSLIQFVVLLAHHMIKYAKWHPYTVRGYTHPPPPMEYQTATQVNSTSLMRFFPCRIGSVTSRLEFLSVS